MKEPFSFKNFDFVICWAKYEPFRLLELKLFNKVDCGMIIFSIQIAKFSIEFLYSIF